MRFIAITIVSLLCLSTVPTVTAGGDGVHWNGYNLDRESIPNRVLIDQDGNNYSLQKGNADVNVVSFIFTTCVDVCPVITSNLMTAEQKLQDVNYQFISVTVDPETDSPEILKEYMEDFGATWPHLTGDLDDLQEVWYDDFQIAVETQIVIEETEYVSVLNEDISTVSKAASRDDLEKAGYSLVGTSDVSSDRENVNINALTQFDASAEQNDWEWGWTGENIRWINGDEGETGYTSPPIEWYWELHTWNHQNNIWQPTDVSPESIGPGQFAYAPNSTDDTLIPIPEFQNRDTFVIVQADGQNDTSFLDEGWANNALSMTKSTGWGIITSETNSSVKVDSITGIRAPDDLSWTWELHTWNKTTQSWEGTEVDAQNLSDQHHVAWAPNSTSDSSIPKPPHVEKEVLKHRLGVVYPGGETVMVEGSYTDINSVSAIEHSIETLEQSNIEYVADNDSALSINGIEADYNLYVWHELGEGGEYSHWMPASDSGSESYLGDDYNHYAWIAEGENSSLLTNPVLQTQTSHSTQTFILDEDWKPIVVWLGYDWNVDDFVDDVKRAAHNADSPGEKDDSGLPGFTFATVGASLGLAIIAARREE